MKYNKVMCLYLSIMVIVSIINFLVFLKILPFDAWKIALMLSALPSLALNIYEQKNKDKIKSVSKKKQMIHLSVLIIWGISLFMGMIVKF